MQRNESINNHSVRLRFIGLGVQALNSLNHTNKRKPNKRKIMSEYNKHEWPLWEIFIRSRQGLDHKHVGSLHAADAQMAIENARDVYTRRMEGISIWVVES